MIEEKRRFLQYKLSLTKIAFFRLTNSNENVISNPHKEFIYKKNISVGEKTQ